MKNAHRGHSPVRHWFLLLLFGFAFLLAFLLTKSPKQTNAPAEALDAIQAAATNSASESLASEPNESSNAASTTNPPTIGTDTASAGIADGKDITTIRQWAHNDLEVDRMLAENDRIHRRQLVVLKETAAAVVERNRLSGDPIRELTLAGLDGQEIRFEVKNADVASSGLRGMFYGHVAGKPDSLVTLAFFKARQAYTVLSPSDNLFLDVEPHNDGDVIVKSIILEKYGSGLCGVR